MSPVDKQELFKLVHQETSFATSTPARMVAPYKLPVLQRSYVRVPGSGYDNSANLCQNVIQVRPPTNVSSQKNVTQVQNPENNRPPTNVSSQQNVTQVQNPENNRPPTNVSSQQNVPQVSSSQVPNNQQNKRPRETEIFSGFTYAKKMKILHISHSDLVSFQKLKKENEQLKKEYETLKTQVSLFKQLIQNPERLNSVLCRLKEKAQEA